MKIEPIRGDARVQVNGIVDWSFHRPEYLRELARLDVRPSQVDSIKRSRDINTGNSAFWRWLVKTESLAPLTRFLKVLDNLQVTHPGCVLRVILGIFCLMRILL